MQKPVMIGSINCRIASRAKLGRKAFIFDGTTLDLVKQSIRFGAKPGDVVHADFGGGFRKHRVYSAPHDQRAGGFWVEEQR